MNWNIFKKIASSKSPFPDDSSWENYRVTVNSSDGVTWRIYHIAYLPNDDRFAKSKQLDHLMALPVGDKIVEAIRCLPR